MGPPEETVVWRTGIVAGSDCLYSAREHTCPHALSSITPTAATICSLLLTISTGVTASPGFSPRDSGLGVGDWGPVLGRTAFGLGARAGMACSGLKPHPC